MKAYNKMGSFLVIQNEISTLREEMEGMIKDKVSMFPSFSMKNIVAGHMNDDFLQNQYRILIEFGQTNSN